MDDVITEVVAVGVAPEPDPAATTAASKAAPTAIPKAKSSFLDAVPIDLIEKRRSTRARGGGDILNEDTDSATVMEVTVKSMLESFIPR